MESVLYIIGALWIILGSVVILYTDGARKWHINVLRSLPSKGIAFLPIAVGALLMFSAPWSHTFWLVEAVGVLAVLKGLLLLLVPGGTEKNDLLHWWGERASDRTWRFAGLVGVILGVFLVLRL